MSSSLFAVFFGCMFVLGTAVGPTEACRTVLDAGQQGGGSEFCLPPCAQCGRGDETGAWGTAQLILSKAASHHLG